MSLNDANSTAEQVRGIVRSYSDRLEVAGTDDILEVTLIAQERRDQAASDAANLRNRNWNTFLLGATRPHEPDLSPEQDQLDKASESLVEAWQRFVRKLNKKLPEEQKIDVTQPPNFLMLQDAVEGAQWSWKAHRESTRIGRFHGGFTNLAQTLSDYKDLLAFIPTNDKYICLLTGSLSALAKATINHQSIADGISEALDAVRNDMQYWRRQIALYGKNLWMRSYILRLYVIIFNMYADIFVEWSSTKWDRLKGSFDRSFFDKKVASKRAEMKILEQNLEREAHLETHILVREMPTRGEIQAILQKFGHSLEERLGRSEQHLLAQLAHTQLRPAITPNDAPYARSLTPTPIPDDKIEVNNVLSATKPSFSTQELKNLVRKSGYDTQGTTRIDWMSQASKLIIEATTYDALQRWVHGNETPCIWIEGPYDTPSPSESSLISAALLDVSRRSRIQYISYFCTEATIPSHSPSFHSAALAKMLHSLVAQLVSLLPAETKQSIDLSEAQILALSSCSLPPSQAIEVLRELMAFRPAVLICLIDGLQVLEDRGSASHMAQLREIVNLLVSEHSNARVMRTCFTTDGNSGSLADLVGSGSATRIEYDIPFDDTIGAEGTDMSML